jgi:hypothetical protein
MSDKQEPAKRDNKLIRDWRWSAFLGLMFGVLAVLGNWYHTKEFPPVQVWVEGIIVTEIIFLIIWAFIFRKLR